MIQYQLSFRMASGQNYSQGWVEDESAEPMTVEQQRARAVDIANKFFAEETLPVVDDTGQVHVLNPEHIECVSVLFGGQSES
jgi:hypothetical protein